MKLILFFATGALCAYILGYVVGKWTAEAELEAKRAELGLNDDMEDEYDLFEH